MKEECSSGNGLGSLPVALAERSSALPKNRSFCCVFMAQARPSSKTASSLRGFIFIIVNLKRIRDSQRELKPQQGQARACAMDHALTFAGSKTQGCWPTDKLVPAVRERAHIVNREQSGRRECLHQDMRTSTSNITALANISSRCSLIFVL